MEIKYPFESDLFLWRLFLNRFSTMDNLKKKNVRITSNNWLCPVCGSKKETTTHVFFSCKAMELVWKVMYSWGRLIIVLPLSPGENFWQKPSYAISIWNLLWCTMICYLW